MAVLLALFNGAAHLQDQLDSIARQTHHNWSLTIRDDRSCDRGLQIARRFAAKMPSHDIRIFGGAHLGSAHNFLTLLKEMDAEADYAAFSDQDDVWMPQKLAHAVNHLAGLPPGVPALYCGRTILTNARLAPVGLAPLISRPTGFRNALVQNIAGGNTMVVNRAALEILNLAAGYQGPVPAHDWWTYQVVTGAGGVVIFDSEPMVLYRQHGRNLTGPHRGARARLRRLADLAGGKFSRRSDQNIDALQAISPLLTTGNAKVLAEFAALRQTPAKERLRRFRALGLYRQTRAGQAALLAAAALGRI